MKLHTSLLLAGVMAAAIHAGPLATSNVSGQYLEVRSCDVYTGPCFANAEMNLTGKEGMMFWSVQQGEWNGVDLSGLGVIAVVKANGTLGNLKYQPRSGDAVLVVDAKANSEQKQALEAMAQSMAGKLISRVVDVQTAPIHSSLATCDNAGCATLTAGDLVTVRTSCLGGKHDVCGNEETFYPPLTPVQNAYPVFTEVASFTGDALNVTWQLVGTRSAFLGTFDTAKTSGTRLALNTTH